MPKTRTHEDAMLDSLGRDPQFAAAYLTEVFADGDQAEMMLALRRVAQAHGGVAAVAQAARLNENTLYRTLSPKGNPELRSLHALLQALGMRLAIQPA